MSHQQGSQEPSSNISDSDGQVRSLPVGPASTSEQEGSPSPQLPQLQPNSAAPAGGDTNDNDNDNDNGSLSDVSSGSLARKFAVEEHEEYLKEQVRIELGAQEREAAWRRDHQAELLNPQPQQMPPQQPPLTIGAPLGRGLTVVEAATRLVSQWEAIHEATLASTPEGASPIFEELTQARAQLAALTARHQQAASSSSSTLPSEEETQNPITTPLNSLDAHKSAAVDARIRFLVASLEDSHFPPERANIAAAVSLYRSARIPYSANWAILYAGHLVDFAPTYASLTADRAARLDRYARLHGEGWLWLEPPLAREPGGPTFFSARRGTFLPESDNSYDMGHYSVTMSFRRMKNLVYRGALVTNMSRKRKHDRVARSSDDEGTMLNEDDWPARFPDIDSDTTDDGDGSGKEKEEGRTNPLPSSSALRAGIKPATRLRRNRPSRHPLMASDRAAPTLHFRMLLDSGATLPLIYDRDARALGIRRRTYAAVSRVTVETASDQMPTWLYEMHVSVVDTQTCETLVSPTSPVWPAEEHALGGVTLVMTRPSPRLDGVASFSSPCGGMNAVAKTEPGGEAAFLEAARTLVDIAEGRDYGRLSGLLPFKVCYVQSTPGLRTMWVGEDRRDVLGAQRMPGQMRWAPGTGRVCDPGHPRDLWKTLCRDGGGNPALLRMAHEESAAGDGGEPGARLVDVEEQGWKGRSEVLVVDKTGTRRKHIIEPRSLEKQQARKQHVKRRTGE
ncbi:hypothetical protein CDEST_12560 [Colletotrichum destructivum]|uniref:Uncharacterized protein n=1 Tax=Colletotrichum destructivum TaxID=34406 RepID=A0AAX4IWY3_9PEZI|nr:hypothetical protein CDEST_12560 [Colletotrichum destructivum]